MFVRTDATSLRPLSVFARDPDRFKLGMLMAAKTDMAQYLDVYHAVYRPVVEVREHVSSSSRAASYCKSHGVRALVVKSMTFARVCVRSCRWVQAGSLDGAPSGFVRFQAASRKFLRYVRTGGIVSYRIVS